jgi:putative SOS response-associated peptidase YedK
MDGFFEWKAEAGKKQPYYIHLAGERPMKMAGLFDTWQGALQA